MLQGLHFTGDWEGASRREVPVGAGEGEYGSFRLSPASEKGPPNYPGLSVKYPVDPGWVPGAAQRLILWLLSPTSASVS